MSSPENGHLEAAQDNTFVQAGWEAALRELQHQATHLESRRHMQRSTDAILTTHTGSLPRPDDLVELLYAAESGDGIDPAALHQRVRSAVAESVAQQLQTGIDIVDDGEMSKVSYSTYVNARLTGFEQHVHVPPPPRPTPAAFPPYPAG